MGVTKLNYTINLEIFYDELSMNWLLLVLLYPSLPVRVVLAIVVHSR